MNCLPAHRLFLQSILQRSQSRFLKDSSDHAIPSWLSHRVRCSDFGASPLLGHRGYGRNNGFSLIETWVCYSNSPTLCFFFFFFPSIKYIWSRKALKKWHFLLGIFMGMHKFCKEREIKKKKKKPASCNGRHQRPWVSTRLPGNSA